MNALEDNQANVSPLFLNLLFDKRSERQIRQLQREIERAEISTAYSTGLFQGSLRPHISLTAYSVEDPDQWDAPLHRLLAAKAAFPLGSGKGSGGKWKGARDLCGVYNARRHIRTLNHCHAARYFVARRTKS